MNKQNKFALTKRPGKPGQKCECRRPGCKGCSKPTESKARAVVATLIGEGFDPELEELEASELEGAEHEVAREHDETDMSNPEERTEVEIAHEILGALDNEDEDVESRHETIRGLCHELLDLHGKEEGEGPEGGPEGEGEQDSLEDFEADLGL